MNSPKQGNATLFGHPSGLFILFLTEMWERFSFYGMRAILVLFLIDTTKGGLGWSKAEALNILGINMMFVYLLGIPGGIIADRYIGHRTAVVWGGILQCIGHFLLALSNEALFMVGLGCIAAGTGLLKPNISTMVGELYAPGDARRDAGFTIFYMGINVGSLFASLIVGFVGEVYGWHYGFSLAGFGILIGLLTFWVGQRHLATVRVGPQAKTVAQAGKSVTPKRPFTREEVDRLIVLVILLIAICTFFMALEQAGGLMTLYAEEYTNRYVFGWEIPASTLQALNPIFVILLGPTISLIWSGLSKRYQHLSSIHKMGVGNVIAGFGFLFMIGASLQKQSSPIEQSALHWLVGAYLFHTIGELCLSPVSLSFITKVAPQRIKASMMGIYFAAIGIANWLASQLGQYSTTAGDLAVFRIIFIVTVCIGTLFIFFNKPLMKLTHGSELTD